jgi:alpha-L-fucosidase 2
MGPLRRSLLSGVAWLLLIAPALSQLPTGPAPESNLKLTAPIDRWDEAIPLGNGLVGGLLWGGEHLVKLSLDRGDLWDTRTPDTWRRPDCNYAMVRRLVSEGKQRELEETFRQVYLDHPYPTKIPAGRLEINLGASRRIEAFELDLATATAGARLDEGSVEAFTTMMSPVDPRQDIPVKPLDILRRSAWHVEPITMLRITGAEPVCSLVPPAAVKKLGYPPAELGKDGQCQWFVQKTQGRQSFAVVVAQRPRAGATEVAVTITTTDDGADPLAVGKRLASAAVERDYDELHRLHAVWWKAIWDGSGVRLPDAAVQQQYDLVQYFYGAASRPGFPPIPLQGLWTADAGDLPPWKGDYHNDLNTQLTYWAYLASGRFGEGAAFLDFMWKLLPRHRRFAREFFHAPGAAVPGVMSLAGDPMGGWCAYSLSPTMGAWVAQAFYLHWRYTMDDEFLVRRAYPYCEAIAQCLEALLKPDASGKLKLPLSSSPEIHDNRPESWLTPNSNFDLALLRWLFGALVEMAEARSDATGADHWRSVLDRLDPLAVEDDDGLLRLAPDESLTESHRHFSHLMAIHPLGTLTIEGSPRDRKIIDASLDQLERLGTRKWCGYSFSWLACMAARTGKPELAQKNLDIYLKAFISRNGFHLNGDYKRLGYSDFHYRPFTLEGNFAAAQAVHEMLLQSWGGTVRVFPAVPKAWGDVSFRDLRAEGAFIVSAERHAGKTASIRIRTNRGGTLRLRDPFDGRPAAWNRDDVRLDGTDYLCKLAPGETLEGTAKP